MRWYDRLILGLIALTIFAGGALAAGETKFRDFFLFHDNFGVKYGTDGDVTEKFDGTKLTTTVATDDTEWEVGDGTTSADLQWFGNIPTAYWGFDASASTFQFQGPVRFRGANTLSSRYELKWVAGSRGKPSINADIQNAAEATRMIADPDFEVLGTNGSSDDVTFYVEGGVKVETDGAADDQVIVLPHLDASQSAWAQVTWGSDKQTEWECDISTGSAITDTIVWAGLKLTNTQVTATDNDQVFFRYEADVNDGEWQGVSSIGGTDTETDLGVVVAVSTRYHLKITIDSSRIARFYLNGALVKTTAALSDATDFIPYIGIENDGGAGAAKHMYIFGQTISRVIG
jgi:hypothetical protein